MSDVNTRSTPQMNQDIDRIAEFSEKYLKYIYISKNFIYKTQHTHTHTHVVVT